MKISNYIFRVLVADIRVFWSWGVSNVTPVEEGLTLVVDALLYKGAVRVVYDAGADYFKVEIGGEWFEDILVGELVNFIDARIEKDCNDGEYEKRVKYLYEGTVFIS
jgi:hypothetical protein